jgi:plastocyanin
LAGGPAPLRSRLVTTELENAVQLHHVTASLVTLAAVAGAIAGCGSSDAKPNAAQSSAPAQHASPSGDAITISNFKFTPGSLTVSRGARITVANHDGTAHTATADDGRSFDTGNIDPGAAATVTLSKAGTYKFHCTIHPFMHGTLVVG